MRNWLRIVVLLSVPMLAKAEDVADDSGIKSEVTLTPSGLLLDVFSAGELKSPQVERGGKKYEFHPPVVKEGGPWQYRAQKYFVSAGGDFVLITKVGDDEHWMKLKMPKFEVKVPVVCEPRRLIQIPKDLGLRLINLARVARGLQPVQFDQRYAEISRINNEMGGVHRYVQGSYQAWAGPADPKTALDMWLGPYYSSHGGPILMNPGITKGATHSHPVYGTTFSGGS